MSNSNQKLEFGTAIKFYTLFLFLFFACDDSSGVLPNKNSQTDLDGIVTENVTGLTEILGTSVKSALQTPNLFLVGLEDNQALVRSSSCATVSLGDEIDFPKKAWIRFDNCDNNDYDGALDVTCYTPIGVENPDGPDFSLATQDLSVNGNTMATHGGIEFNLLSLDAHSICYNYKLSGGVTTTTSGGSETYFPAGMTGCLCINLADDATPNSLQDLLNSLQNVQLKIDPTEVCCSNNEGASIMCSCIDTDGGFILADLDCGCPSEGILNIHAVNDGDPIDDHEHAEGTQGNSNNDKEDSNDPAVCDCDGKELEQICHLQGQGQAIVFINLVLPCPAAKAHLKNHESDYCGPCQEDTDPCNGDITSQIDFGADEHGRSKGDCDEYIAITDDGGETVNSLSSCNTH